MKHPIRSIIKEHKKNSEQGIYSVCSANPFVLEAAMLQAKADHSLLLIEATSNQVDQFGGYTGMTPEDFHNYVRRLAGTMDFPVSSLVLGGDHLGPNVWQNQPAEIAMNRARDQIASYIEAGFTKIHLDASMPLKGDEYEAGLPLNPRLVAQRTAELCLAAEHSLQKLPADRQKPVYVIGTDVPVPGGAKDSIHEVRITPVAEVAEILDLTQKTFAEEGLESAWERVVAIVVQPGVEFGDDTVIEYDRHKSHSLSAFIDNQPNLVYEAHSTDYQTPLALKQMVEDHLAILKVGPWLTFALREAIFALSFMEEELTRLRKSVTPSHLMETIERVMLQNPAHWIKHYHGTAGQQAFSRKFSYSDRIRYYWPHEDVALAVQHLIKNLETLSIPDSLVSQYLPNQYRAIRAGEIEKTPRALLHHKIREVLAIYSQATAMRKTNRKAKNPNHIVMESI